MLAEQPQKIVIVYGGIMWLSYLTDALAEAVALSKSDRCS